MQNGICEAFNGRMRDELLNETIFYDLDHARAALARWTAGYNACSREEKRSFVDDPPRAAGDREGVRTNVSHVFAECLSHMYEGRTDIRADGVDFLRKFIDQTGKKRDRVFGRSFSHLPVSVFGDLLDSEQERNAEAAQVHMINGDFKTVGPRQIHAREGRTNVSPTNFTESIAL